MHYGQPISSALSDYKLNLHKVSSMCLMAGFPICGDCGQPDTKPPASASASTLTSLSRYRHLRLKPHEKQTIEPAPYRGRCSLEVRMAGEPNTQSTVNLVAPSKADLGPWQMPSCNKNQVMPTTTRCLHRATKLQPRCALGIFVTVQW